MQRDSKSQEISLVNKSVILVMPLFGCLASMVSGYFIVYFTMLEEEFRLYHGFTVEQNDKYFTMMVTVLPVGAFLGSFIYNRFVNAFGENQAMKVLDIIAVIATIMQILTLYFPVVLVSRLLMGFYCAITTGVIPSWILSMSPQQKSGIFGTFNYLAIVFGMALAYSMGDFLETSTMNKNWKLALFIGIPILASLVHLFGLNFFGFDNIERLIETRDHGEVIKFMKRMYGKNWRKFDKEVRHFKMTPVQIPSIKEQEQEDTYTENNKKTSEKQNQQKTFLGEIRKKLTLEILKKKIKSKICVQDCDSRILGIMLAVASQTSGIFAILEYSKQLFDKIQETNAAADSTLIILGFFQVIIVLMSGFFINKFGRRPMMLIGQVIVVVSLFLCTILTMVMQKHQILLTCVIFIYILGYSISLGPLFMMYAIQALLDIQMIIKIYWGLMIVFTLTTDILIEQISISIMFCIFFLCSALSFFFFRSKMIETKGIPKKEIKQMINRNEFMWQNSQILFSKTMKQAGSTQKSLGTI